MSETLSIRQKLETLQKRLGVSQTKLAERLGVSFVAFNNWWNEKSMPRPASRAAIDELYLRITGQRIIPVEELTAKKQSLNRRSVEHPDVLQEITDHPDIRDNFILKLTYNSNRIEGSTLTEPDTAAILFENAALPDKSLTEHLEAKNHQTALNHLFDYLHQRGTLNEAFVLRLHSILMNGVRSDAGVYRAHAVRILGVSLPTANFLKIPELIPTVMTRAKTLGRDVIATAAEVHARFEQIHPFSDGNGRVGRLLLTAMLLRANLAPALISQAQKRLYYTYLYKAQTADDTSQLENFFCDAVADGFRILEREDV